MRLLMGAAFPRTKAMSMNESASPRTPESRLSEGLKKRLFLHASGALLVLTLGVGLSVVATLFGHSNRPRRRGLRTSPKRAAWTKDDYPLVMTSFKSNLINS